MVDGAARMIKKVFAVWADNPKAGHQGTYNQPFGGSFAKMAVDWLDVQLKHSEKRLGIFRGSDTSVYPDWKIVNNGKLH